MVIDSCVCGGGRNHLSIEVDTLHIENAERLTRLNEN